MMASLPSMHMHLRCHCHCDCHSYDEGIVAVVDVQASLPLSSWHCCPCSNGLVALDLQLCCCPCHDGVITLLKLALPPLLQWCCRHHRCCRPCHLSASWHHCRWCAGIFAIVAMLIVVLVTMALLLLLIHRHVAAGVKLVALPLSLVVKLALSSTSWWYCCHCVQDFCWCRGCNCCPHDDSIIAIVNVQTSLPSSRWHCGPCNNGAVALDSHWCCCTCHDSIVAILKLALLPSLQWHCHHHQCTGVFVVITMALLLSLWWHCCPWFAGVFAVIAMAIVALVAMVSLP